MPSRLRHGQCARRLGRRPWATSVLCLCLSGWTLSLGCQSASPPSDPAQAFLVPDVSQGGTGMMPEPDMNPAVDMAPAPDVMRCPQVDEDGDGVDALDGCGPVDCDDGAATVFPGSDEVCDGLDNDCDGETDEGIDEVSCGVGECARVSRCEEGVMAPCVPGEPTQEVCNQLDDNCDGIVDNHDVVIIHDTDIETLQTHQGECTMQSINGHRCLAAIHRFCRGQRCTDSGFGPILVEGETIRVACVADVNEETVPFFSLARATGRNCRERGDFDNINCGRAYHEWCLEQGYLGGFGPVQMVDTNNDIACLTRGVEVVQFEYERLIEASPECDPVRRNSGTGIQPCNSAFHRVCQDAGFVSGYGPIDAHNDQGWAKAMCFSDPDL